MASKKTGFLIIAAALIFIISPSEFFAQRKRARTKAPPKIKTNKKSPKPAARRIISGGVLNGKAGNLVKPEFSEFARKVGAHGTVVVRVLIDERGNVVEAEAVRGNPLLIPNSLKAARASKLIPCYISGEPVMVSGVIHYNYLADRLNWLELGYAFGSRNSYYSSDFEKYLPAGFEEERQLIEQSGSPETRLTALSSIENKLSLNDKNFWLFSVGRLLGEFSNAGMDDKTEVLDKIQNLLYSAPDGISPQFKKFLADFLDDSKNDADKTNQSLQKFADLTYLFGK